ncbi:hypothetical protein [Bacillus marinisedimentorum]|uniref:hypothetical protein n=1 Tax=Bacillus marinisedimentorum TaxID=1821260 RepID=UPI0007E02B18|nr:hypothetical protein [Bacillus marinisedimentorum]
MSTLKNYYAGVYSSKGYVSLHQELADAAALTFLVEGKSREAKSAFIRKAALKLMEEGLSLEYFHSPLNTRYLEGLAIPEKNVVIFDADRISSDINSRSLTINPQISYDEGQLAETKAQALEWEREEQQALDNLVSAFRRAHLLHIEKEKIYLSEMDFDRADDVTGRLLDDLFVNAVPGKEASEGRTIFFGASTPDGPINFIDNITEGLDKRIIIKGRPGSGKSTMMKKIAEKAAGLGLRVDRYPCSFDPGSLDMIAIPAIAAAVFDGTSPHKKEPFRPGDVVVDMFKECISSSVEMRYKEKLDELDFLYQKYINEGIGHLKEAGRRAALRDERIRDAASASFDTSQFSQQIQEMLNKL